MRALLEVAREDRPFCRLESGPFRCFIVTDPEVAAKALTGPGELYRRTPDLAFWFPPAGEGVASSPHEKWKRQRRLLAPYFKASAEDRLAAITEGEAKRLIARITDDGPVVDLQALVMETTLRTAVQHLLVKPFPGPSGRISEAIQTAMHYATPGRAIRYRVLAPVNRPLARRFLHPRAKRRALAVLDAFVDEMIATARKEVSVRAPLMEGLLDAESMGLLDEGELRDQVATFLVAAVDSVGSAVTWTQWQLAQESGHAERAGQDPVHAEACALESMRLIPPLWIYWREMRREEELAGLSLRKGDLVVFVPFVVHMRPDIWPDPEQFLPDRFLNGAGTTGIDAYAYLPFGHGAHACLGRRMAISEARILTHQLQEHFRFELQDRPRGEAPVEVRVAVLMDGGMPVRAERR
ncbi:MAG: cytochrome P450 [Rhodothermales bacterium]|nr:cytochrome P450 [Rhodothermales bacterium]MBO6780284.1 cytochrome P450 [Rhodothermales bacterium]